MFDLPQDVVIEILSRLPVKSLGKFKSVSKYWFSLISSTNFVKLHHHRALSDTKTNHSRIFIKSTHSLHSVDFESSSCYEDIDDNDTNAVVSLKDPLEKESLGEKSLGSCYGLVFFVCYNVCIFLWNPTTQTTRLISNQPTSVCDHGTRFYGLGYDFSTDDYKMVRAVYSNSSKSIISEVFNLKTSSWRKVQASYIDIDIPEEIGIFSNGALHWLRDKTNGGGFNKREVILSFGLKDEIFEQTRLPNDGENEINRGFSCLGDLKGCLYAAYGGDHADLDIWVMKEYGVENSWSKMISLKWAKSPCDYEMTPVCFTRRGDVVVDLDLFNLARFSLTEKTYTKFKKCATDWHYWVVYTETLASPYG